MKAHTIGKTKISTIKDHINNMQDSGIFISNQNLFSIKTPVIKNPKKNQPENIYNSYDESSLYSSKFLKEEHEFKLKSDKSKDSFQNVMIKQLNSVKGSLEKLKQSNIKVFNHIY
jgi:hypothetical protein